MLDYITVRGFKSIESILTLAIGSLTVLIGPNGSGKTNFLGVFSFLHAIREGRLQEYVATTGGADRVLHFGSRSTPKLQIHVSFENAVNQYAIDLVPNDADRLVPLSEAAFSSHTCPSPAHAEMLPSAPAGREAGISRRDLTARPDMCESAFVTGACITFTIPAPHLP